MTTKTRTKTFLVVMTSDHDGGDDYYGGDDLDGGNGSYGGDD